MIRFFKVYGIGAAFELSNISDYSPANRGEFVWKVVHIKIYLGFIFIAFTARITPKRLIPDQ